MIYQKKQSAWNKTTHTSQKSAIHRVALKKSDDVVVKPTSKKKKLSESEINTLTQLLKKVRVHIVKWYNDTAKNLIIEWLAIDKNHRELNIELAMIYEKEENYKNAEYIYKDILILHKDDYEVLKRLGYILAVQKRYEEALKIYEKAHKKSHQNDEVIEHLADITFSLNILKKSLWYIDMYLKDFPRNVEKLFMKWHCLEELGQMAEAIGVYKKILDLQPYNTQARDAYNRLNP